MPTPSIQPCSYAVFTPWVQQEELRNGSWGSAILCCGVVSFFCGFFRRWGSLIW